MSENSESVRFRIETELGAFSNLAPQEIAQHVSIGVIFKKGQDVEFSKGSVFFGSLKFEAVSVTLNPEPKDLIPYYLVKAVFTVSTKADRRFIEENTHVLFGNLAENLTDDNDTLLIKRADYYSFEVTKILED